MAAIHVWVTSRHGFCLSTSSSPDAPPALAREPPFKVTIKQTVSIPQIEHVLIVSSRRNVLESSREKAQVGFCPVGRILFRGSTVALCGSVAGRPESPSFLIPS
jgi:hypothetical protein